MRYSVLIVIITAFILSEFIILASFSLDQSQQIHFHISLLTSGLLGFFFLLLSLHSQHTDYQKKLHHDAGYWLQSSLQKTIYRTLLQKKYFNYHQSSHISFFDHSDINNLAQIYQNYQQYIHQYYDYTNAQTRQVIDSLTQIYNNTQEAYILSSELFHDIELIVDSTFTNTNHTHLPSRTIIINYFIANCIDEISDPSFYDPRIASTQFDHNLILEQIKLFLSTHHHKINSISQSRQNLTNQVNHLKSILHI